MPSFGNRVKGVINSVITMANWMSSALEEDNDVAAVVDRPDGSTDDNVSEVWGIAGVQSRPKDGVDEQNAPDEGYAKVMRVQFGDAVIVIGTHDPRHVEPVDQGELCIHALGKDGVNRALIRLKPDGSTLVEGDSVCVGNNNFANFANGDALKALIDAVLAPPVITAPNGPDPFQAALVSALNAAGFALGPVAPTTSLNIQSTKHKVEI